MGWQLMKQFYKRIGVDLELPRHEHSVYVFLLYTANDDGTAIYPSMETIARATHHTPRQARTIVRSLEREGFLICLNVGRGRGNKPLWHTPLDQWGNIEPRPPVVESTEERPATSEKRARRAKHLTEVARPGADEPFLDVDQIGKEIVNYHQALTEYDQGYVGNNIRVFPQPGQAQVKITDVTQSSEMEAALMEEFHALLDVELAAAQAKVEHRQNKLDETRGEAGRRIMQRLLNEAMAARDELLEQIEVEQRERRFL